MFELVSEIINYVKVNLVDLVAIYTGIVTVASVIVKLTPTLKDDDILKGVIEFVGKYIALNRGSDA